MNTTTPSSTAVLETIRATRMLPIVVIDDANQADPLADVLLDAGLPFAHEVAATDEGRLSDEATES
ncbi:hypothetical protein ACIQNG_38655 [Streptomyces sp. NPDC091377]|uniref:hypothetical protein n=1 Tax=Streptomyces sp. NPDC091377 TaxID=3365995 RepID=UPI00382AD991